MRSSNRVDLPLPAAPSGMPTPASVGVIALNRMAFGPAAGDLAAFNALAGDDDSRLQAYVDQQLNPAGINDAAADARIASSGFSTLDKTLPQLWADHVVADPPWETRIRPVVETQLATFIRAVYSRRQLFEVLVEFWHDHFSVFGWEFYEAPAWVHYDRDVIRAHTLGNFRQLLEANAKSTDMLIYLDNWVSSQDGPNENYAREVMELHTLGAGGYFGTIPRSSVPDGPGGVKAGFVEEDVFSVARCLTGWSLSADPYWDLDSGNGTYLYRANWHDNSAKNVLGVDLPANQPAEKDGQDVLDILANHPTTARHICYKLCRRLIGDFPPDSVVDTAAAVFLAQSSAPDQIARVVRTILLSNEFRTTWGSKVKRPFEIVASAMRAGTMNFLFSEFDDDTGTFEWLYYNTGQRLFGWHPPNGYPDVGEAWVSSGPRVMSWRLTNWLVDVRDDFDTYRLDAFTQTPPGVRSANDLADYWIDRILGRPMSVSDRQEVVDLMAQGFNPTFDLPLDTDSDLRERLQSMVGLIFMSPEFLWR